MDDKANPLMDPQVIEMPQNVKCRIYSIRNTAPATQNSIPDRTDLRQMLCLPGTMKMEVSKVLCLRRNMQFIFGQRRQSIASATENDFRHVCRYVRMSGSATLACKTALQPAVIPKETTRDMLELQNAFSARHPQLFTLRSFKMDVFREVFS